jgi:small subunit ribosomal protein S6
MKKYELMYIINPLTTDEQKKSVLEFVDKTLSNTGAAEIKLEKLGEKKLAYPINKKETGFYVLVKFNIDGIKLVEIEKKLNINEDIMRYILVKQD